MNSTEELLIAGGPRDLHLLPRMANRHGLITGATGTGKTVSLQVLAESLSAAGVPIFMADVKGDLAGLARPGQAGPKIAERISRLGLARISSSGPARSFSGTSRAAKAIPCGRP